MRARLLNCMRFDIWCLYEVAGVAQLVERHPSKVNVVGSSPIARSLKKADIAQG
jgi:hypothetical protein